jgi:hypothetical protein
MKKLLLISLVIFLASGFAYAKELETTKKAGPFTVTVKLDKNPPIVGDNNLSLTIKDSAGKIVKDAKVSVDYEMPAMPGMPAMRYKVQPALSGEAYVGKVNFSMGGAWSMNIKISQGGKTASVKMNVDVS